MFPKHDSFTYEYDQQCPEGLSSEDRLAPREWRYVGAANRGERIYETPRGRLTWCSYTELVWAEQRAAIAEGREPSHEIANATRAELIAHERVERAQERERRAAEAQFDHERKTREAAEAAREQAQERAYAQREEERALAELKQRREDAIGSLAILHYARIDAVRLASARICELQTEEQDEQKAMRDEKEAAKISGYEDAAALQRSARTILELQERQKSLAHLIAKAAKAKPDECTGPVADIAQCMGGGACTEATTVAAGAWSFAETLLQGKSIDGIEQDFARDLSPAQIAEAKARAEMLRGSL